MKTQFAQIKDLKTALEELTNNLGIKNKLKEYDAVVHWEKIVGAHIAKVTKATRIVKGVLYVQVKASVWRNELVLKKKEIMNRINSEIGIDLVKDIKFR